MYSDIHVAVGTKHCMHDNMDTMEQCIYSITPPIHLQQRICNHRHTKSHVHRMQHYTRSNAHIRNKSELM